MSVISELASGATGGIFGGIGSLVKDIREAWTGDPSPEKQAEISQKLLELENQSMSAQAAINLEEAKSEKLFVSGWRPFIGWIGGSALAYSTILEPLMRFVAKMWGYAGVFPIIDTTLTMQVLIGILGLGAYRSYDKKQTPTALGKE